MYSNSSSGFALAEMIISLAAVTLAIALVAGLGQQVMQLARSSKQTAAVVELRSKTTAITRNLDSWIGKLRSSPHTGATFAACIPDPSTPVSVFNCPDVNADLLNNDAELKRIAGTQLHAASVNVVDMLGEKLAGTLNAPVLYDLDGRICTSNCALKATGFMLRSNPANDSTPGSVKFVVKVEPHSRAKGQSPIRTSYLSIDVGSEWQQPTGLCPSGSIKVGYLSNGKPSCINPTKKCATNTVHLGLDGSGNPICKAPPVSCAAAGGSVVINADGTDLVCATNLQSAVPCQSNEIFLGYYAGTGVPMCSSTNLSCPDGQVQIGIAQQGANLTAQCKTLPSCQDSQKLSYDGSQFVCKSASVASTCNPGEVVVGINEDGSAKCEIQERNLASNELNCPAGKYVSGLEPSGKVICSDLPSTNNSSQGSSGNNEIVQTKIFYHCTNDQSNNPENAPCYGASRNRGAGDGRYRALTGVHIAGQGNQTNAILTFWDNVWKCSQTGIGHYNCVDGSVLVADTNAVLDISNSVWTNSCPTGMSLVGSAGSRDAFCIETNARTGTYYHNAAQSCFNENKKLCTYDQWATACMSQASSSKKPVPELIGIHAQAEWIFDAQTWSGGAYHGGKIMGHLKNFGANSCLNSSGLDDDVEPTAANIKYRCCSK